MKYPVVVEKKIKASRQRLSTWLALALIGTTFGVLPASAQTPLDYEMAVLDMLRYGDCRYDNGADQAQIRFARQIAPKLGLTAVQITDPRSPYRRELRDAVARLGARGLVTSEGEVLTLVDCAG